MQFDPPAMFFQNLADDGEAEPCPFVAGGDIGFEQAAAIFLRQTDAVIDDVDHNMTALPLGADLDATLVRARRQCGAEMRDW